MQKAIQTIFLWHHGGFEKYIRHMNEPEFSAFEGMNTGKYNASRQFDLILQCAKYAIIIMSTFARVIVSQVCPLGMVAFKTSVHHLEHLPPPRPPTR